jgi:arsenite/tail-anchored protein-transporting ATPase
MTHLAGLLDSPPRFLFFTGKGGVGKTSLACATAVALADRGHRVLLVSTDPASNLEDVLGVRLSGSPTPVPDVPTLAALDIDPEAAAAEYRERTVGPYRGVLPEETVREMEEQLSGACTLEVAAFDRFVALLAGNGADLPYDHVVFDTAPTGHTLRLLQLPAAWDRFLADNTTGASCLGPLSALGEKRALYGAAVAALADASRTALVLVARGEESALTEAERTRAELAALGITGQWLAINGVLSEPDRRDPLAAAYASQSASALAAMPEGLAALPRQEVPLRPFEIHGLPALRALLDGVGSPAAPPAPTGTLPGSSLGELVDELAAAGHGLIMVMGKGGVGKTTTAAAIAVELARHGLPVHLTTTDPAAHLAATLVEEIPGFEVSRIDPREETRKYTEHVLATTGKGLDAAALALLEEDLRSPCTEEVAVFRAFSQKLREPRRRFVVLDTAPTGHTLLLLDATGAYHRDVMRKASRLLGKVTTPLDMLRDPGLTHVLVVTLAQSTPVLEAERLQADLRRAAIEPWAWVVNRSLAAAGTSDLVLAQLAAAEAPHLERVDSELAPRLAVVPWLAFPPVGPSALRQVLGERQPVAAGA